MTSEKLPFASAIGLFVLMSACPAVGPPGLAGPRGAPGVAVAVDLADGGTIFSDGGVIVIAGPPGPPSKLDAFLNNSDGGWMSLSSGSGQGTYCIIGQILLFAYHLPDSSSVLPADGRTLTITSYTSLFSLIGTTYGGDGISNFQLPDLQPVAPNNMAYGICVNGVYP